MSKIGATTERSRHLPIDKVGPENLRQSFCYHTHHLTKAKDVHYLPEFFFNALKFTHFRQTHWLKFSQ